MGSTRGDIEQYTGKVYRSYWLRDCPEMFNFSESRWEFRFGEINVTYMTRKKHCIVDEEISHGNATQNYASIHIKI